MAKSKTVVAALAASIIAAPAALALDQSLPAYHPVGELLGHIKSVGSDTLGHEMTLWAKAFESLYPRRENRSRGDGVRDRAGGAA